MNDWLVSFFGITYDGEGQQFALIGSTSLYNLVDVSCCYFKQWGLGRYFILLALLSDKYNIS
jgi:hypothetical protein